MKKTYHTLLRFGILGLVLLISCNTTQTDIKKKASAAQISINMGEAYLYSGDYTSALKEFLEAQKINPNDPFLQNDLGLVYMYKQRIDLAITHFKKAIKLKPDYTPAKNNLGTAYLTKADWDTAITIFSDITDDLLYATPHYPLLNLGWAYYNKSAYPTAEAYYKKALKIHPTYTEAMLGLSRVYMATARKGEAVKILERAIKIAPDYTDLHWNLANVYSQTGALQQAIAAYQKVMALIPNTDAADQAARRIETLQPISK